MPSTTVAVKGFKGYVDLPNDAWQTFSDALFDRHTRKAREIIKPYLVTPDKPAWVKALPEGHGAACIEFQGLIVIRNSDAK